MSFEQVNDLLALPDSSLHSSMAQLGTSTSGCRTGLLYNKCTLHSNWWAQSTGKHMASHSTQALWNAFCNDCNSVLFGGINANGNDGAMWKAHNLHPANSWGCNDDTDGNSLCQIQVCGRYSPKRESPSYHEELYASGVNLPNRCGTTGKQGAVGEIGHMTFMVECGQRSKLTICLPNKREIWPTAKTCFVKKRCIGVKRVGIRKLYAGHWYTFNAWGDESADVAMWLTAIRAAVPEIYDKMVTMQCSSECGYF